MDSIPLRNINYINNTRGGVSMLKALMWFSLAAIIDLIHKAIF